MSGRILLLAALCTTGCFTVGAGTPTSGITPVPRRDVEPTTKPQPITLVADPPQSASNPSPEMLHQAAVEKFAGVDSYCARLRRRESPNGTPKPEELMLFKERKNPFSVHFKWIGPEATGREVLYVKGQYGDKLNILTAAGDIPFVPAGRRMALARDSMLVKAANPNHDITDAGLSYNIRDIGELLAAARNPSTGVIAHTTGAVKRNEYPQPLIGIEIAIPAGRDPDIPRGGKRQIMYDPVTKLPVVYLCFDEIGREQNFNAYDRLQLDLKLDDDDFSPDKLWGKVIEPSPKK